MLDREWLKEREEWLKERESAREEKRRRIHVVLCCCSFSLLPLFSLLPSHFSFLSSLQVRASIDQFSHTMAEQARLDVEGYHLDLLNYNFRSWSAVKFPRTIFTTQSIIIETFEDGELISDLMALSSGSVQRKNGVKPTEITPQLAEFIVTTGETLYLKMLLVDNLMHADLHPGNILLDTTTDPEHPMLSLVDAGMVAQLDEEVSSGIFHGIESASSTLLSFLSLSNYLF